MADVVAQNSPQRRIWVSASDVADIFDIPPGTIRRWVTEGRIATNGRRPARVNLADVLTQVHRRDSTQNDPEHAGEGDDR